MLIIQSTQCFLVPDGLVAIRAPAGEIVGYRTTLRIKGTQKGLRKFLGIPYAEPPTGKNRFRRQDSKVLLMQHDMDQHAISLKQACLIIQKVSTMTRIVFG